jgi:NAD(P)-dependent dehydrogenase (short-subunit alcohol dehydrogenase family)
VSRVKIKGSRAVVTGGGSGIGKATALRFAKQGAEVVCVDIDAEAAEKTALECGGASTARHCDVSNPAAVERMADAIESEQGPVDVLVNNAGVGIGGPFLQASVEDWDWLMGVNLNGVAYGCHAFGTRMVARRRGHVVNVASGAAYIMSRELAAYCASKAAVLALSRCLRADWASAGVGVSVICPGVINTPIATHTRMVGPLAERQEWIARTMRLGHSPDLVAKAIVRAIERNQEVVPVGLESELAYRVLPFIPGRIQALATRTPLHRIVI